MNRDNILDFIVNELSCITGKAIDDYGLNLLSWKCNLYPRELAHLLIRTQDTYEIDLDAFAKTDFNFTVDDITDEICSQLGID